MAIKQLILDFEPPDHDTLEELISHVAYSCGKPLKVIAADMDWSPTQLSQYLNERNFPAKKLPDFIRATAPKGHEIVTWLVSRFLAPEDPVERAAKAILSFAEQLPELQKAIQTLSNPKKQITLKKGEPGK